MLAEAVRVINIQRNHNSLASMLRRHAASSEPLEATGSQRGLSKNTGHPHFPTSHTPEIAYCPGNYLSPISIFQSAIIYQKLDEDK